MENFFSWNVSFSSSGGILPAPTSRRRLGQQNRRPMNFSLCNFLFLHRYQYSMITEAITEKKKNYLFVLVFDWRIVPAQPEALPWQCNWLTINNRVARGNTVARASKRNIIKLAKSLQAKKQFKQKKKKKSRTTGQTDRNLTQITPSTGNSNSHKKWRWRESL